MPCAVLADRPDSYVPVPLHGPAVVHGVHATTGEVTFKRRSALNTQERYGNNLHRAASGMAPLEDVEVFSCSSPFAGSLVPRAVMGPAPP